MATNIVRKPGQQIEIVPTDPALPVSGATIRYGNETGIALTTAAAPGQPVTCDLGPFEADLLVTDTGNAGIAAGDILWRHDGGLLDNVPALTGYYYGRARGAVAQGQAATIRVYHDGAPGASGVIGAGTVGTAQIAANGVTADKLSAAARTRAVTAAIGAVTADAEKAVFVAPTDGTITGVQLLNSTAITADSTNYWTFQIVNKGAAGEGTDVVATIDTNSGESGDGESLAEFVATDLTVVAGEADFEAGDVLSFKAIKAASATALADTVIVITYAPVEAE